MNKYKQYTVSKSRDDYDRLNLLFYVHFIFWKRAHGWGLGIDASGGHFGITIFETIESGEKHAWDYSYSYWGDQHAPSQGGILFSYRCRVVRYGAWGHCQGAENCKPAAVLMKFGKKRRMHVSTSKSVNFKPPSNESFAWRNTMKLGKGGGVTIDRWWWVLFCVGGLLVGR